MRTSSTSWLVPGGWLDNVGTAAGLGWASGVELLVFEYDGEARAQLGRERAPLVELARAAGLELSVHLPDPLVPEARGLVRDFAEAARLFVLHPPAAGAEAAWAALVGELARILDSAPALGASGGGGEARLCLEFTTPEAFARGESSYPGLALCADTGALLRAGLEPAAWIAARRERVAEIHLHAARGDKDHLPPEGDEAWLRELLPLLEGKGAPRVVLELFGLDRAAAGERGLRAAIERDSAIRRGAADSALVGT